MNCNIGNTDRILRITVGATLIALAAFSITGLWAWIGVIPLATGVFRICPAYNLLGINTAK
jgi:hypothetical protein